MLIVCVPRNKLPHIRQEYNDIIENLVSQQSIIITRELSYYKRLDSTLMVQHTTSNLVEQTPA
jgi:hypothetical protein